MKTLRMLSLILAGLVIAGFAFPQAATAGVSFDFFYSNLSPHGNWVVSGNYGRVWQPAEYHAGWNPYYDGRWGYTDAGWTWDSDYAWGAIPYHYGTWSYDPYYGWVWVPGYTWAPSWVVWRTGPGYIGWAPVAPSFSIGVSFHFGDWDDDHFTYIGDHDFMCDHVGSHVVPVYRNQAIYNNTTIINNNFNVQNGVVHNQGLGLSTVERATGRKITPVPVDQTRSVKALGSMGLAHDAIRVNPAAQGRGLRAAQPVPASTPLPKGAVAAGAQNGTATKAQARGFDQGRGATAAGSAAAAKGAVAAGAQSDTAMRARARGTGAVSGSKTDAAGLGLPVRQRPDAAARPVSSGRSEASLSGRGSTPAKEGGAGFGLPVRQRPAGPTNLDSGNRPATIQGQGLSRYDAASRAAVPRDTARPGIDRSDQGHASAPRGGYDRPAQGYDVRRQAPERSFAAQQPRGGQASHPTSRTAPGMNAGRGSAHAGQAAGRSGGGFHAPAARTPRSVSSARPGKHQK